MAQIVPPKAPALTLAPREYAPDYMDRLLANIRLYFSQIDQKFQQLLLGFNNYGEFYSTATQTNPVPGTANLIAFDTTDSAFGVSYDVGNPSRIEVTKNGVYAFHPTMQLSTSGGATVFNLWYRLNGTNVPYSALRVQLDAATEVKVATNSRGIPLEQGDYVELVWTADDAGATLTAVAAVAPVPAIPSVRVSVVYSYPCDTV